MKQATFLWKRFCSGVAQSALLTPLPYSRSPFTSGERALSEDWKQVGADLRAVINAKRQNDTQTDPNSI